MTKLPPAPPVAGSLWARIERAREALAWNVSTMGEQALGNRTGYTKIRERNWRCRNDTQDRIITRLTEAGFSEAWLRAGQLPERVDSAPLPEVPSLLTKLGQLARRLGLQSDQIVHLWDDLQGEGPLERFPEEVQRAAFAAAYLEGRSFEDVRAAVRVAQKKLTRGAGIDTWLHEIRGALRDIKPGSGTRPGLSLVPAQRG